MARNVASDLARLKYLCSSLGRRGSRVSGLSRQMQSIVKRSESEVNRQGFMEKIVQARFDLQSTDAFGRGTWEARVDPGDGHPILNLTGRLKASAIRAVRGAYKIGKVVFNLSRVSAEYGKYHQNGLGNNPKRPFFNNPTKEELLPADNYCVRTIKRLLRRALG